MKRLFRKLKTKNQLIVCIAITLIFLALLATVFNGAFGRLGGGAVEFGRSVWTYIQFLFTHQLPPYRPTAPPSGDLIIIPDYSGDVGEQAVSFFRLLITGENLVAYLYSFETFLFVFSMFLPCIVIIILALRRYIRRSFTKQNNKYNKDTKALKIAKMLSKYFITPIIRYIKSLVEYIKNTPFFRLWLLIALFSFNIFAIILSLFGIVIYFFISFDFVALYYFLYGAIDNIFAGLGVLPLWLAVLFVGYLVLRFIDRWRRNRALGLLNHMENMNKGFILERSICLMPVGSMGTGKTLLLTDIALSIETIFRHKAREFMLDLDLKFPHFPWIVFENELKDRIEDNTVFNLASAVDWVVKCEKAFSEFLEDGIVDNSLIWDYDYEQYGMMYDDKLKPISLFTALESYAQLYLIYTIKSSLIYSNYAIRTDFQLQDNGNMPNWNLDFFSKDSKHLRFTSRHSHILDFNMLRLGKKLLDDSKRANSFEFGVIAITEVGKERGNQFKEKEVAKELTEAKDKLKKDIAKLEKRGDCVKNLETELKELENIATINNDKFNSALKLIRHKSTVCNFPFARVIMDDQRPESLGADVRDLCEIVHIQDKTETKLAMPFFFIGELVYSAVFGRFTGLYNDYRFNRGDNTLLMHLIKSIGAGVHMYYTGIYNLYGYHIRKLGVENSATSEVVKEAPYYLMHKKIYSGRYATDAYKGMFSKKLKDCNVGIEDITEYDDIQATQAEFDEQRSYLVEDMKKY